MNASCTIVFRDQYKASLAVYRRSTAAKGIRLLLIYVPAGLLTGGAVLAILGVDIPSDVFVYSFLALGLGLSFRFLFPRIVIPLNLYMLRRKNPSIEGRQSFEFSSDGMKLAGALYVLDLQWAALHKVVETRDYFLFFTNPNWAFFLPKHALESSQFPEFRRLIESCAPGRAELLSERRDVAAV
jgi:amino acid transporter